MFNEIKMTIDDVIKKEEATASISSGVYKATIKQAFLRNAKETQSKALALHLMLTKDMVTGRECQLERNFNLWFIGKNGDPIDFGGGKIIALQYLLGLDTIISPKMFSQGVYDARVFNQDAGAYEQRQFDGFIYKDLIGKICYVLVGVKYEIFNGDVKKNAEIISFLNHELKTSGEVKSGVASAESYKKRLEKAIQIEKQTYGEVAHLIPDSAVNASNVGAPKEGVTQTFNAETGEWKNKQGDEVNVATSDDDDYIPF